VIVTVGAVIPCAVQLPGVGATSAASRLLRFSRTCFCWAGHPLQATIIPIYLIIT
jgi:hypothetical protein